MTERELLNLKVGDIFIINDYLNYYQPSIHPFFTKKIDGPIKCRILKIEPNVGFLVQNIDDLEYSSINTEPGDYIEDVLKKCETISIVSKIDDLLNKINEL